MKFTTVFLVVGLIGVSIPGLTDGFRGFLSKVGSDISKSLTGITGPKCLIAKHSGKVLHVPASSAQNGVQMIQGDN